MCFNLGIYGVKIKKLPFLIQKYEGSFDIVVPLDVTEVKYLLEKNKERNSKVNFFGRLIRVRNYVKH